MPTGYQIKEQDQLYFLTFQIVEWVDIFTRKENRDIVIENLKYCNENKGLEIYGYVIMSNHIHLLLRSDSNELSKTIKEFKSYTAKQILKSIESGTESRRDWMLNVFKDAAFNHKRNSTYQLWTHENHAEHIYSNKFMEQKLNYIHPNPVRAGLVLKEEDYVYSSAINYFMLLAL
ncbi:MAG: REP-associated tyrosine transposase [Salibacteraceae bacterium]